MPPPFFTADGDSLYTPSFSVALHALNDALPLARIFHTQLDQTDFTEDTEPRPQSSQSGQGVWLRVLGLDLCALCEKGISLGKCD